MALRCALGWADGELMRSDCKPCTRLMRHIAGVFSVGGALSFWILCCLHNVRMLRYHWRQSMQAPYLQAIRDLGSFSLPIQQKLTNCSCGQKWIQKHHHALYLLHIPSDLHVLKKTKAAATGFISFDN